MVCPQTKQGSHSILNEYFQADRQKAVLFAEWLILNVSPYGDLRTVSSAERELSTLYIKKEKEAKRKKIITITILINLYMNNIPGDKQWSRMALADAHEGVTALLRK